jgi:hypothetical protein
MPRKLVWIEAQSFVRFGILQAINDQEEVANLIVERDKTLLGKTTPHRIDVYWKFEKTGITYETIVQAKDCRVVSKKDSS